jgi:hypothetical protein
MARNANIRPVDNAQEPPANRYGDQQEAMRDLKFAFRRLVAQLETSLKMANLENAGPNNAASRRKAFQALLRGSKAEAAQAFDVAIAGME